jgi:hypothetical protein
VSVGFVDADGTRFAITRSRDSGSQAEADAIVNRLSGGGPTNATAETLMKTSLIRDEFIVALSLDLPEQQRFEAVRAAIGGLVGPDYSERTAAILDCRHPQSRHHG